MKVAIISYSEARNPGAQLQSYALERVISRIPQVDECVHVMHRPFQSGIFLSGNDARTLLKNLYYLLTYSQRKRGVDRYLTFQSDCLRLTELCDTKERLEALNDRYDLFVSGSDQIWSCNHGMHLPFFLDFVNDNRKKVAYGASMGIERVPERYKEAFIGYLKQYNRISVREKTLKEYLQTLIPEMIFSEVTDPVFLLKKEEWLKIIASKPIVEGDYIFVYSTQMTSHFKETIKVVQKDTGCKVVSTRPLPGIKCEVVLDMGPREFLNYEYNAKYIITTSFHAIAFGIIFHKELFCIPHSERSSRPVNLLKNLNINRVIKEGDCLDYFPIDYDAADKCLDSLVRVSYDYLWSVVEETHK